LWDSENWKRVEAASKFVQSGTETTASASVTRSAQYLSIVLSLRKRAATAPARGRKTRRLKIGKPKTF